MKHNPYFTSRLMYRTPPADVVNIVWARARKEKRQKASRLARACECPGCVRR